MQSINSGQQAEGAVPDLNAADLHVAGFSTPEYSSIAVDWKLLVQNIQAPNQEAMQQGMEKLYRLFSRGVRFYLRRQLGPFEELEDKVHDIFLIVVQAIQGNTLREPERLIGFIRTVASRQVAAHIDNAVRRRRDQAAVETVENFVDSSRNSEQGAIKRDHENIMVQILRSMSRRDREVLTRFYLHDQDQEQICQEMGLTETQFRLLKSRAKARFSDVGKHTVQHQPGTSLFVRKLRLRSH
jgi:RNA polymerase sigma factor (sigma-70 family)